MMLMLAAPVIRLRVGIVELDHVKDIRLYVLPHLVERGTIKPMALLRNP
jgi:hypothetical protein